MYWKYKGMCNHILIWGPFSESLTKQIPLEISFFSGLGSRGRVSGSWETILRSRGQGNQTSDGQPGTFLLALSLPNILFRSPLASLGPSFFLQGRNVGLQVWIYNSFLYPFRCPHYLTTQRCSLQIPRKVLLCLTRSLPASHLRNFPPGL